VGNVLIRALSVLAVGLMLVLTACGKSNEDASDAAKQQWKPGPGGPLSEPHQINRKVVGGEGVLDVTLTATTQKIKVSGTLVGARPFDGKANDPPFEPSLDGPTLNIEAGDTIRVTFVNKLGKGRLTNIHYHGLQVSPLGHSDNVFRKMADGKTYESVVKVPTTHPSGTYWYHAHFHSDSDSQVMGGLSGLLIIKGSEQRLPEAWRDVPQRQMALRDIQVPKDTDTIADNDEIDPGEASFRFVNALYQPTLKMKSNRYEIWRLANIGSDVFYEIALDKHKLAVIAEDGLAVWKVVQKDKLLLPPGKRFDVLVRGGKAGKYQLLSLPHAQSEQVSDDTQELVDVKVPKRPEILATLTVEKGSGPVSPAGRLPTSLADPTPIRREEVDVVRKPFVFSYKTKAQGAPSFQAVIDNVQFDDRMIPPVSPILDTVEEWHLQNATTDDHPFHIHVNDFFVVSVNGKRYPANSRQDTVIIPKQTQAPSKMVDGKKVPGELINGEVVIRTRFKQFTGWFVYHCHILSHEDIGMMATIQVRKDMRDPIEAPPEADLPGPHHNPG